MDFNDIVQGIGEWNNLKGGQWQTWNLPNTPILRGKLPKPAIDFVWKKIEEAQDNYQSMKKELAGNITESLKLEDTDDYFFKNFLKETSENYISSFEMITDRNPFNEYMVKNLYMQNFWVNFSKQHEFNPIHDHTGVLSFVLWMKIPTTWQSQQEISVSSESNLPSASNFQFLYTNIFGKTRGVMIDMDPMMEGCILMFPSILQHQVYPFYNSDEYRVSVSGNLCLDPKSLKDML
tara:strand:+ start:1498 stop:2202 length:705 start_codon:yes stop_codon:yes gene_type:complete